MIQEGRGKVAPAPVAVQIPPHELRLLRQIAIDRANYRGYDSRADAWGRGVQRGTLGGQQTELIGGPIPYSARPIICGLAGEWATALFVNSAMGTSLGVDCLNKPRGDGDIDLELLGLSIQVKTKFLDSGENLVRSQSERGAMRLNAHVYVFCQWNFGESVKIYGCIPRRDLLACRQERGKGSWMNYVVSDDDLLPASRIRDELKGRAT